MTDLSITDQSTDQTTGRRLAGLRRAAALSAVVAFGLLTPTVVGASPVSPSEPPPGPGDVTSDPGCEPDLPCDVDPDPDECDPLTEICDFTSGGDGPDDPCESETPPESCDPGGDPGGDPGPDPGDDPDPQGDPHTEVDVPVRATPNFTG